MKNLSLYIALAISAGVALIYQVAVSNILFYYFTENSYSVATVLSTFLIGLAIGSYLFYLVQNTTYDKAQMFSAFQFIIAIYGIVVFTNVESFVGFFNTFDIFLISAIMLLVPTILLGAIFPLTLHLIDDSKKNGLIYAIDLVGAAAGALIAGFYLIPLLGNKNTILTAVVLGVLSGFIALKGYKSKLLVLLVIGILSYLYISPEAQEEQIPEVGLAVFEKPSPYGEVTIENQTLYIDRRDQCAWDYSDAATERQITDEVFTHINKPDARVLNIGLGCGLTLERLLQNTIETVDVVEINPVVVEANRTQTDILDNPQVNLTVSDGIQYVANTEKRYDSVIVDITNPAVLYSSNLYTKETFADIADSLVDGGVFGLWVYRCDSELYSDILYNTLSEAFEYVYMVNENIFLASDRPLGRAEYVRKTGLTVVNYKDTNYLAREYYEQCRFGDLNSEHYMKF